MANEATIEDICKGLHRYYITMGHGDRYSNEDGVGKFTEYCDEIGIEDEGLEDEFAENADECLLCQVDEDEFPLVIPPKDEQEKKQMIMNILMKLKENPNTNFGYISMNNSSAFTISDDDTKIITQLYETQCPYLWNEGGLKTDKAYVSALAIGYKNNQPYYLQNLVDDYFRFRIQYIEQKKPPTIKTWIDQHPHFTKLKNIAVNNSKASELLEGAVKSFGARCSPKLMFKPPHKIDDSLENIIQYIEAVTFCIANLFDTSSQKKSFANLTPFQFDLCIATGKPIKNSDYDMNTYGCDDDDEEDEKDEYIDYVADIDAKLKQNELNYKSQPAAMGKDRQRVFQELLQQLSNGRNLKTKDKASVYPQGKRIIGFVDRRKSQKSDPVYLYEAPSDCSDIPQNAVPEWYLNSSKTCLLPRMKKSVKNTKKEQMAKISTATVMNLGGGLLTLSFHVITKDEIRVYLFYNAQITRFMPQDIKTVFPKIFNMYDKNKDFSKSQHIDESIKMLEQTLKDKAFAGFQQQICTK